MAKLEIRYDNDEVSRLQTPIIVECKERILGTGSGKRKFKETFNETERRRFPWFYKKFYRWHLVTGIPHEGVVMPPADWSLIQRYVEFFAAY